jgi:hypothetical protein
MGIEFVSLAPTRMAISSPDITINGPMSIACSPAALDVGLWLSISWGEAEGEGVVSG